MFSDSLSPLDHPAKTNVKIYNWAKGTYGIRLALGWCEGPDLSCHLWTLGRLGRLPDPPTTHSRLLLPTKILIRVKWEKGDRGGCIDQRACVWAAVSQSEAGVGWDGKRPPLSLPPPQHLLHAPSLSLISLFKHWILTVTHLCDRLCIRLSLCPLSASF